MVRFRTVSLGKSLGYSEANGLECGIAGLGLWRGSLEAGDPLKAVTERWLWPGWSHGSASGEEEMLTSFTGEGLVIDRSWQGLKPSHINL